MARNKFDVDENLESPFSFAHLKRAMKYVKKHAFKMVLALVLSWHRQRGGAVRPEDYAVGPGRCRAA